MSDIADVIRRAGIGDGDRVAQAVAIARQSLAADEAREARRAAGEDMTNENIAHVVRQIRTTH